MMDTRKQGEPAPDVVPGYGEADDEAASMMKAAEAGGEGHKAIAGLAPVPDDAGPVGHGTTETDVKARIAEAAARAASKPQAER